jgi:hypothetical protein
MHRYWSRWLTAATLVIGMPMTAAAQTQTIPADPTGRIDSHWLASGFVGTNFGQDVDDPRFDLGGTVGYLWRGVFGGEFHANFSPGFHVEGGRGALLENDEPWVNSYMFNAVGALPLGASDQWQPYVSGGFGSLTLRSDVLASGELEPDGARPAANIGGGILGFPGGAVGFRGDLRFFHGFDNDTLSADENPTVGDDYLSGLTLWRGTAGIAFRW